MPTVLTERIPILPSPAPRKRWTREECERMEATGVWGDQKLELVEGDLIDKLGKKRPHSNGVAILMEWLVQVFPGRLVNVETPIDVAPEDNPTNEPQPDLLVLTRPTQKIRAANPGPADLRLVVEVSDSSLSLDLGIKARLYARAGIAEYWVVDVQKERIVVHRDPRNGFYDSVTSHTGQEAVSPLAAPEHSLVVASVFE